MKRSTMAAAMLFLALFLPVASFADGEEKKGEEKKVEETKVTGSASIGVYSKYIFRGYELSRDSAVIQPSLSMTYRGFTAAFWGNIDTGQHVTQSFNPGTAEGQKGYNETDITLSYTHSFNKLSLAGGYIYYGTKYANETEEFFLGISYDTYGKPALTVYRDVNAFPGTYINLSLAHSFKLYREMTLDLGASFGYFAGSGNYWNTYETGTGDYTGSKYGGFHDGMVKAGLTIPVTKSVCVQPTLQWWFPLSADAKRTMGRDAAGNKISYNPNGYLDNNLVGGLTVVFNF